MKCCLSLLIYSREGCVNRSGGGVGEREEEGEGLMEKGYGCEADRRNWKSAMKSKTKKNSGQ